MLDARAQRAESAPDDEVSRRSKQRVSSKPPPKRRPKRNCHVASYQFRRDFRQDSNLLKPAPAHASHTERRPRRAVWRVKSDVRRTLRSY